MTGTTMPETVGKVGRRFSAALRSVLTTFSDGSAFGPGRSKLLRDNSDSAVLQRATDTLREAIRLGREGNFTVVPEIFSISATDNCNLRCIMCPGHSGMTGPRLSLDEAQTLFAGLNTNRKDFGTPTFIDMTAGEPLLNTQLHKIFKSFKDVVPEGRISIISNATLPVKGRVKEALMLCDSVGISIDGATKETHERIRKGSIFENVMRNTKAIAALMKEGSNFKGLRIMFVAMDQNIHELPAMARLAKEVGATSLFAQAVEVRNTPFLMEGDDMGFNIAPVELRHHLDEAQAEANRLGILFEPTNGLLARSQTPELEQSPRTKPKAGTKNFKEGIKLCNIPWINSPRFNLFQDGVVASSVCCHMPQAAKESNLTLYPELKGKSINSIYNSNIYWDVREHLLDGTIATGACRGCQYYEGTQLTPDHLRAMERAVQVAQLRERSE